MKTTISQQAEFETKVCEILKYKVYGQNEQNRNQMIISDLIDEDLLLSGTIAINQKPDFKTDFLLVATRDSEVNYIETITLKMIREIIKCYTSVYENGKRNKIILASNIPLELHSHTAKELREKYNFHVQSIGFSFCEKNNLQHTEIY